MMSFRETRPITDETLNAYVDGELHHMEAAHVARSAANDPKVAERIAVLHRMKAGVAWMADDVLVIDPPMPVAVATTGRSWSLPLVASAAAIMLTLSVLWLAVIHDGPSGGGSARTTNLEVDATLERFVTRHDVWIDTSDQVVTTHFFDIQLEDLMARSGLRLVHHTLVPFGDAGEARHIAFVGQNGCRLSLFQAVSPSGFTAPLTIMIEAGLLTARWAEAGRSYALVTRSMDPSRFTTIAAALHDASDVLGSVDAQVLARLQQARQPCLS